MGSTLSKALALLLSLPLLGWLVIAEAQGSYVTAGQCRDQRDQKLAECKRLGERASELAWKCRGPSQVSCVQAAHAPRETCMRQYDAIANDCNRLQMAEDKQRALQEKSNKEAQEAAGRKQRESIYKAATAASAPLGWVKDQRKVEESGATGSLARNARALAAGNAVMGMLSSLIPSDDSPVNDVYVTTAPLKAGLQHAMPDVAANVQDHALNVLQKQHQDLQRELSATLEEMQRIGMESSQSSSYVPSSAYRPAITLAVGGGADDKNPWAVDEPASGAAARQARSVTRTENPTNADRSLRAEPVVSNPWADSSNSTGNNSASPPGADTGPLTIASADNPWATKPPPATNPSRCDDIRAGRIKYKWNWLDQKGRRCFSNAASREKASVGAVCCD